MIKLDARTKQETEKVDVYVGGKLKHSKDKPRIYLDRPVILDDEGKPMLLSPQDARLRNLTYATKLFADIDIEYTKDGSDTPYMTRTFERTYIGSIPLMLHSDQCMLHGQGSKVLRGLGECHMDPGGYFIVDGKEKVIISQERITTNRLFVSHLTNDDEFSLRGYIRCTGKGETALSPRTVELKVARTLCYPQYMNESEAECYNGKPKEKYVQVKKGSKGSKGSKGATQGAIYVSLPSINGLLPLTTVFRALGIESDKAITEAICGSIESVPVEFLNFIRPSLVDGALTGIYTLEDAQKYMIMRTKYKSLGVVQSILTMDLFPNVEGTIHHKAMYLGYLVSIIMKSSLNIIPDSDRDGYVFKRVDISGILLAQLFQETYNTFRKDVRNMLDKLYNFGTKNNEKKIELEKLVEDSNLHTVFNSGIISDVFAKSLKGMWGPPTDDPELGLVQDISRISYIGFMSHLRRVNMPLDRTIKITSPHRLHPQQWGVMCPFESPDGASIGYLKNFALMTQITSGTDEKVVFDILYRLDVDKIDAISHVVAAERTNTKVFVNGSWYGITNDPHTLCRVFRMLRRNGLINPFISVAWNIQDYEIRLNTEPGRPCRPLLIVGDNTDDGAGDILMYKHAKNTQPKTWFDMIFGTLLPEKERNAKKYVSDDFLSPFDYISSSLAGHSLGDEIVLSTLEKTQCYIEYLDIEEENTMYIAMTPKDVTKRHTHVEIHPSTVFSIVTHIVPFANHNQGPRVIFHAAQSKQALGIYATNFNQRFDTNGYIHHYPQKRIVTTRGSHYNGNDRMPNGTNVIVAVATYSGYNQEDSIIINKTSVDRGLFHITGYKTMVASEKTLSPNERVKFANPTVMRDEGKDIGGIRHANYTLLGKDGIITPNSYIPRGQDAIVLGMVNERETLKDVKKGVLIYKESEYKYRDVSLKSDVHHYGKIDKVFLGYPTPGNPDRICKVKFRKVRRPELGDKHCSAHGQKGVVGMIIPQENMPFSKDGIVPDLIINPHAFPSRMTIGHLVETVMAKVCCMEGVTGDGTVFIPFDKEALYDSLEKQHFQRHGNEILYNGRTGQQIKAEVFMGPIYYYRLKHMVADKVHSRSTGAKTQLTHQPTSGRSAGGGLRIGEMERDVLLGHGIALFAKECMMEKSDKYKWAVCRHCGTIANYAPNKMIAECGSCNKQEIAVVNTPYSFKLLIQELESMGLQMRLSTELKERIESTYEDDDMETYDDEHDESEDTRREEMYIIPDRVYAPPEPAQPPTEGNEEEGAGDDQDDDDDQSGGYDTDDVEEIGGSMFEEEDDMYGGADDVILDTFDSSDGGSASGGGSDNEFEKGGAPGIHLDPNMLKITGGSPTSSPSSPSSPTSDVKVINVKWNIAGDDPRKPAESSVQGGDDEDDDEEEDE
jgi:DNA-directed RNA polymerase II subunit RPB2